MTASKTCKSKKRKTDKQDTSSYSYLNKLSRRTYQIQTRQYPWWQYYLGHRTENSITKNLSWGVSSWESLSFSLSCWLSFLQVLRHCSKHQRLTRVCYYCSRLTFLCVCLIPTRQRTLQSSVSPGCHYLIYIWSLVMRMGWYKTDFHIVQGHNSKTIEYNISKKCWPAVIV